MNFDHELDFLLETAIAVHRPTIKEERQCRRKLKQQIKNTSLLYVYHRNQKIFEKAFQVYQKNSFFTQKNAFLSQNI